MITIWIRPRHKVSSRGSDQIKNPVYTTLNYMLLENIFIPQVWAAWEVGNYQEQQDSILQTLVHEVASHTPVWKPMQFLIMTLKYLNSIKNLCFLQFMHCGCWHLCWLHYTAIFSMSYTSIHGIDHTTFPFQRNPKIPYCILKTIMKLNSKYRCVSFSF